MKKNSGYRITGEEFVAGLTLADAEHLGAANGAGALRCRTSVFKGDCFGITDLYLFPAFHAICLHHHTS